MKLFRRINTQTGIFIEECMFENHPFLTEKVTEKSAQEDTTTEKIVNVVDNEGNPILDPQYISEPVPHGFYWPKWDGEQWVEGGEAPEPQPQPPSEEQRLSALEDAIMMLTLTSF